MDGEQADLTREIIGAAIEVQRILGPGLLESTYEECLCEEFTQRGIHFERQLTLPIIYKGKQLHSRLKLDLLIESAVVIENKSVEQLLSIHESQLLSYLKLACKPVGLLINFNVRLLKEGIKRLVN